MYVMFFGPRRVVASGRFSSAHFPHRSTTGIAIKHDESLAANGERERLAAQKTVPYPSSSATAGKLFSRSARKNFQTYRAPRGPTSKNAGLGADDVVTAQDYKRRDIA